MLVRGYVSDHKPRTEALSGVWKAIYRYRARVVLASCVAGKGKAELYTEGSIASELYIHRSCRSLSIVLKELFNGLG